VVEVTVDSLLRAFNDGVDHDADDRVDAQDPGCVIGADNDESDPAPPPLPVVEPWGANAIPLSFAEQVEIRTPACDFGEGSDVLVAVEVSRVANGDAQVVAASGALDFAISLLSACPDTGQMLACGQSGEASHSARRLAPGTHALLMQRDAFLIEEDVTLSVRITPVNAQCDDGLDNDGDEATDAQDPGCQGPIDADEVGPGVAAACTDGVDDDTDGQTDFPADADCAAAGAASEGARPGRRERHRGLGVGGLPSRSGRSRVYRGLKLRRPRDADGRLRGAGRGALAAHHHR